MKTKNVRRNYNVSDVKRLAKNRKLKVPNRRFSNMDEDAFQLFMGNLVAAGHMKSKSSIEVMRAQKLTHPMFESNIDTVDTAEYFVKFSTDIKDGEVPHFSGYITPLVGYTLKLNAWFNLDGTIRIEAIHH